MELPLSHQKRIDTIAILFALALALLVACISSLVLAIIVAAIHIRCTQEGVYDSVAGGVLLMGAFVMLLIFLSPLWLWIGFRLRQTINWPMGAFKPTKRVTE